MVLVRENSSCSSSCSDGEKQWPRNQTIETAKFKFNSITSTTASSKRSTKSSPAEIKYSPTLPDRAYNHQWRKKSLEVGEGSGSDRINIAISETDPIDCDEGSDGNDGDDWMCNDEEYDSDDLSLDDAKKSKWLRGFFEQFDSLRKDQMDERMHCPACKGGAGANAWYAGFNAMIKHAETVKLRRVKLHRRFAEILSGELKNRSARFSCLEGSLKWKGLEEEAEDHMIVWPPIVILQNTRSHKDETGKWIGLGREELPINIKSYNIKNVKSAYGPSGHTGVTALIFESSEVGYVEAECLHKQFVKEGRGRYERENLPRRLNSSRERVLYGYMATEEDMGLFNKHSKGKPNCKFEMKSHKMMVIDSLKKMRDNDSKLIGLEEKVEQEIEEKKILKQAYQNIDEKFHAREQEVLIIRRKASKELEERKKEIDCLEETNKELADELERLTKEKDTLLQKSSKSLQELLLRESETQTIRRLASEELNEKKDQIEKFYGDSIKKLSDELERIKMEQQQMQSTPASCSNEP